MKEVLKKVRFFNIFYVLIVAVFDKFYVQNVQELKEEIAELIKAIPSIRGKIRITEENLVKLRKVMLLVSEMGGLDVLLELLTELKQAGQLKNARDVGDFFLDNPDLDDLLNKVDTPELPQDNPVVEKKTTNESYPIRT